MVGTNMSQFDLKKAVEIAQKAHTGQFREGNNEPYINHPLRVMEAVKGYGEDYQIVAVLHDTIEDCDWVTPQYLQEQGMKPELIEGVLSVTKRDNEPYGTLIHRAMSDKYGRVIKPADIDDNSNETRLKYLPKKRADKLRQKYNKAKQIIASSTKPLSL